MANVVFGELMSIAGWSGKYEERIRITGHDPLIPTRFRIGEVASGIHAACGVAVANLWELRTGRHQMVEVSMPAALATFRSFSYVRSNEPPRTAPVSITNFYPTQNGRWFYLHGSMQNTSAHRNALAILECEENLESVANAISHWDAQSLEDTFAEEGCCGAMVRSAEEWAAHPQGQILAKLPVVQVIKIGDSPPEPFQWGDRPLSGIRVLDLTRVLARPTCARTLAEHGADVLRIGASHLSDNAAFVLDTGHGKRSAFLDLRKASDAQALWQLTREADVFSQSYRLGTLADRGFTPEALAEARPGIVYVSINCYGHEGAWKGRRGWEQLAQTVTGIADEEGAQQNHQLMFGIAPTDYATGYLGAFGALVALWRRTREGGSYHVRVSLTQSGMLINRLGRVSQVDVDSLKQKLTSDEYRKRHGETVARYGPIPYMTPEESAKLTLETDTPYGRITHLAPIVRLSETPARWTLPTAPLGSHPPEWQDRGEPS
jgi:crotonobetainyl-CoA:carnitine CoA-transferase CaiB-like acyl-CoA transferase